MENHSCFSATWAQGQHTTKSFWDKTKSIWDKTKSISLKPSPSQTNQVNLWQNQALTTKSSPTETKPSSYDEAKSNWEKTKPNLRQRWNRNSSSCSSQHLSQVQMRSEASLVNAGKGTRSQEVRIRLISFSSLQMTWAGMRWDRIWWYSGARDLWHVNALMFRCLGTTPTSKLRTWSSWARRVCASPSPTSPPSALRPGRHFWLAPIRGGFSSLFFDFFYFCFNFPPVEVGTPERSHRAFSSHRTWSEQSPFTRATAERRLRHASGEPTVPFQYVLILESGWKVASRILQQDLSSIE